MLRMGSGHRLIHKLLHLCLGDAFQRHSLQACETAVVGLPQHFIWQAGWQLADWQLHGAAPVQSNPLVQGSRHGPF